MKWSYLFTVLTLVSCAPKAEKLRVLPFLGNFDLEYKLVDGKEVVDTIYPKIPYFSFLNEDSLRVTSKDLKGKVWIADFFFTTCSTICPGMTAKMKALNESTKDLQNDVQFISFTINPSIDKPSVLKGYKTAYSIQASNWIFLTGNEVETHRLGVENFMIASGQDANAIDGYAHQEAFSLVDKEGYVRGVYAIQDNKQLKVLENDLRKLIKEEYGNN